MVTDKTRNVKKKFDKPANRLSLCSGERVKPKRHGKRPPPPVPTPALTIGQNISFLLTLEKYGIRPNAQTVRKTGVK